MTVEQDISPLVKTVVVPVGVDRAFEAFTAETSAWWPLFSHSVGAAAANAVRLEGAVGGRIVEYGADGEIATWGTLSDWDPPKSLSFSWHPGQDPSEAGQVTVTFDATDGGTQVAARALRLGAPRRRRPGPSQLRHGLGLCAGQVRRNTPDS